MQPFPRNPEIRDAHDNITGQQPLTHTIDVTQLTRQENLGYHEFQPVTREMQLAQLQRDWLNWQKQQNDLNVVKQERTNLNATKLKYQQYTYNMLLRTQQEIEQMGQQLNERERILQQLENGLTKTQEQLNQDYTQLIAQSNQLQADRQQWQKRQDDFNFLNQQFPNYTRDQLQTSVNQERIRLNTAFQHYELVRLSNVLPQHATEQIRQQLENDGQRLQRLENGLNQTQGQLNQELTEHTGRHAQLQQYWLNWQKQQNDLNVVKQERPSLNADWQQYQQNKQDIALKARQEVEQIDQWLEDKEQRVQQQENNLIRTQEQLNQDYTQLIMRSNQLGHRPW